MLQDLHRYGGELSGTVKLEFGSGLSGRIGRQLARKLGLPTQAGDQKLHVVISHKNGALYWSRQFNSAHTMVSVFTPKGHYPAGYWHESTGKLSFKLGVNLLEGGWYWVLKNITFMGVPMPAWLFPSSHAYKRITDGLYEFSVTFRLPLLGQLVSYSGKLSPHAASNVIDYGEQSIDHDAP